MSRVMENIGIGELRSNPVADQCLKCVALYIKSIITLILKIQFQASSNQQPGLFVLYLVKNITSDLQDLAQLKQSIFKIRGTKFLEQIVMKT